MNTDLVSEDFAARIEHTEIQAWLDLYKALPAAFAKEYGLENAFKTRGIPASSLELPAPPAPPTPAQIEASVKFFAEQYGVIYAVPK